MTSILDRLRAGEADLHTQRRILQMRLLPDEDILIAIPIMVGQHAEIISDAQTTLKEIDAVSQKTFFESEEIGEEDLSFYLQKFQFENEALSAILLNPRCPADALCAAASRLPESTLDLVVNNQVKILEQPDIVQALREHPALSVNQKQKLDDYERLLLKDLISPAEELEEKDLKEVEKEAINDAKDWVRTFGMEKVTKKELSPQNEAKESVSVIQQIALMSVPQKVQAAIKGNREIRNTLVRDANKLVCSAVIRSPRITDAEAEFYAGLRNVQQDVLRLISMNREWTKSYKVVLTLVKNPRTPIGISTNLMKRVMVKDLRLLKLDRGIPEALRTIARRRLIQKKK